MFKPKKITNENAIKKDFFSKKKPKKINYSISSSLIDIAFQDFFTVNKLTDVKIIPEKDKYIIVNTLKASSTTDYLEQLQDIEKIKVSCNSCSQKSLNILVCLGLSEIIFRQTMKEKALELVEKSAFQGKISFLDTHAKITTFNIKDNFITITGSGNPSINGRNEIYCISNSKEKYDEAIKLFNQC